MPTMPAFIDRIFRQPAKPELKHVPLITPSDTPLFDATVYAIGIVPATPLYDTGRRPLSAIVRDVVRAFGDVTKALS